MERRENEGEEVVRAVSLADGIVGQGGGQTGRATGPPRLLVLGCTSTRSPRVGVCEREGASGLIWSEREGEGWKLATTEKVARWEGQNAGQPQSFHRKGAGGSGVAWLSLAWCGGRMDLEAQAVGEAFS